MFCQDERILQDCQYTWGISPMAWNTELTDRRTPVPKSVGTVGLHLLALPISLHFLSNKSIQVIQMYVFFISTWNKFDICQQMQSTETNVDRGRMSDLELDLVGNGIFRATELWDPCSTLDAECTSYHVTRNVLQED